MRSWVCMRRAKEVSQFPSLATPAVQKSLPNPCAEDTFLRCKIDHAEKTRGRHAQVFDLPSKLPVIAVAAGGKKAAELAATHGSGLFATEPRADLVEAFTAAGGKGPKYAEASVAWAPTAEAAVKAAHETTRWAVTGWKVMAELPNPVNFEAASATVRPEDIAEQFAVGPDPEPYVKMVGEYKDAGFDHIVLMNAGPDPDGFIDFFSKELKGRL